MGLKPGQQLKLRTEKRSGINMARTSKPWYYDMALYKPAYHSPSGAAQTHGFYRPEDEDRIPSAGEEHVPDLIKRLGGLDDYGRRHEGDVRDTPEYQRLQGALKGPTHIDALNRKLSPTFDSGKLQVINKRGEGRAKWRHDMGGSPFTPEFIDTLQKQKADSEIRKAKKDGSPAMIADDSNVRKSLYDYNRKAFMKFVEDLSKRAYMERNGK